MRCIGEKFCRGGRRTVCLMLAQNAAHFSPSSSLLPAVLAGSSGGGGCTHAQRDSARARASGSRSLALRHMGRRHWSIEPRDVRGRERSLATASPPGHVSAHSLALSLFHCYAARPARTHTAWYDDCLLLLFMRCLLRALAL